MRRIRALSQNFDDIHAIVKKKTNRDGKNIIISAARRGITTNEKASRAIAKSTLIFRVGHDSASTLQLYIISRERERERIARAFGIMTFG